MFAPLSLFTMAPVVVNNGKLVINPSIGTRHPLVFEFTLFYPVAANDNLSLFLLQLINMSVMNTRRLPQYPIYWYF